MIVHSFCTRWISNKWRTKIEFFSYSEKGHRFCEWHPIDFATDEPVRQGFRATFSSVAAAEEFLTSFQQVGIYLRRSFKCHLLFYILEIISDFKLNVFLFM